MFGYANSAGVWVPTRNTNWLVFVFGYTNTAGVWVPTRNANWLVFVFGYTNTAGFWVPPGFRRDLILQGLGPPCLRGRPGRRQDLLIQGLARYAPRAPRAARAPKQFINTGLGPPFALGPLRRPGRRKYLLISPRAPQPASLRAEGPAIFFDVVLFF